MSCDLWCERSRYEEIVHALHAHSMIWPSMIAPGLVPVVLWPAVLLRSTDLPSMMAGKFGTKEYWDGMYEGSGAACTADGLPAEEYSWYCGWRELQPFWTEFVPSTDARVLMPGVGSDNTVRDLFDSGWQDLTAFDYSAAGVERAASLYGDRPIKLTCADATCLPYDTASFDAVLDKGTLDAIGIASKDALRASATELARTVVTGGVVLSVSRALEAHEMLTAFAPAQWEVLLDGGLHVAETGEVSTDTAANLYVWRRRGDDLHQDEA